MSSPDACLPIKASSRAGSAEARPGSNPPSASSGVPGRRLQGALTCGFSLPVVTARARREPGDPVLMRTQRGPSLSGARWKHGHAADGAAISALAIPLALVVLLRAPAMQMEFAADPVDFVSEAGHSLLPLGRCHPLSARQCAFLPAVVTRTTTQIGAKLPESTRASESPGSASSLSGTCA